MNHFTPRHVPDPATEHRAVLDQLTRLGDEIASLQSRLSWTRSEDGDPVSRDLTTGLPNRRSLQGYLVRHMQPRRTNRITMWVLALTVTSTEKEPAATGCDRRHRWFRAAGRELAALVGDRGLVGRWSTDEIVALIPSPSDSLCDEIDRRIRSLGSRLPAGLGLALRHGGLDSAQAHDPTLDLSAALGRSDA